MRDPYDVPAHPLAAKLPRDEEGLPSLAASLKEVGLLDPVVLFEGKVLDGLRRLKACKQAGVKPQFVQFNPRTMGDPVAFVLAKNVHRRNVDRARDYLGLVRDYVKAHYEETNSLIALACHVSKTTVGKVRRSLVESGEVPDAAQRVGQGNRVFEAPPPPPPQGAAPAEGQGDEDADGTEEKGPAGPPREKAPAGPPERPADTTTERLLCDANGRVVPAHLRDVFADEAYVASYKAVEAIVRRFEGRRDFYRKILSCQGFAGLAKALMDNLKLHAPHAVCHDCGGAEGAGCTTCASSGWLSAEEALAHVYNPEDDEEYQDDD